MLQHEGYVFLTEGFKGLRKPVGLSFWTIHRGREHFVQWWSLDFNRFVIVFISDSNWHYGPNLAENFGKICLRKSIVWIDHQWESWLFLRKGVMLWSFFVILTRLKLITDLVFNVIIAPYFFHYNLLPSALNVMSFNSSNILSYIANSA